MATDHSARLAELRSLFAKNDIGVYIVQTMDEHNSEYTSEHDNRREFISGFTGSAGTAVISEKKAALATDGRYFLQAGRELSNEWELLKQGLKGVPTWQEWAAREAAENKVNIGVDPRLITYDQVGPLKRKLKEHGIPEALVSIETNLVDQVWDKDQPDRSQAPVWIQTLEYTGLDFSEKITNLRKEIKKHNGTAFVVSDLCEIGWLLNLRGDDIPYNPVFFAYAIVTPYDVFLYIDNVKLTEKVREHLGYQVTVKPYEQVFTDCLQFGADLVRLNVADNTSKKLLAPNVVSWALVQALGGEQNVRFIKSPVELAKVVKNPVEVQGSRVAHIRDGVALIRYLSWLEDALNKGEKLSDYDGSMKSLEFRKQQENFIGLSFETISSSGPNAAVIHYAPPTDSKAMIEKDQVYLLDSGGHYYDGTTDTTRTFHFSNPTDQEKEAFTLVLKGHIALAEAVFPEGSNGYMLDTFARQFLWKKGLNYNHGTGHSIASCSNVHEGPIGIGFREGYRNATLYPNCQVSNEPGYYEDGKFGIRIESVITVKEAKTPYRFQNTVFHCFETITQVPLCKNLMDLELMSADEKKWVDDYHKMVFETVKSYFKEGEPAFEWLKKETSPLEG